MKCPKCGELDAVNIDYHAKGLHLCVACAYSFTDWQQEEIERLKSELKVGAKLCADLTDKLRDMETEAERRLAPVTGIRRLCKALEEIIKLETTPIDETERSQEWRSVGWADAAEIAHKALRK